MVDVAALPKIVTLTQFLNPPEPVKTTASPGAAETVSS
jgi:hypothetical protein